MPYDGWAAPQVVVSVAHRGERLPLPLPRPTLQPRDLAAAPAVDGAGGGDGNAAVVTSDCPLEFLRLIEACWAQDPCQRPTFADIEQAIVEMPL